MFQHLAAPSGPGEDLELALADLGRTPAVPGRAELVRTWRRPGPGGAGEDLEPGLLPQPRPMVD